mgnify:CR=1 FL=1
MFHGLKKIGNQVNYMVLFFSDLLHVKADGSLFRSLAFNGQCEPAFFFPAFHDRHGTAFPSLAFRSGVSRAVFQIGAACSSSVPEPWSSNVSRLSALGTTRPCLSVISAMT